MRQFTRCRLALRGLAAVAIALFGSIGVSAQQFQYAYGSATCTEGGLHGVKQLAGGGYVAVGESFQQPNGCGTSDPYVVVTDPTGAQVWSNTYPIGTNGRATDVLELPNGELIVLGYTQIGPTNDIFLLHLAANGALLNSNTYGSPTTTDEAWKVICTTVGNNVTTFAGDYVIAGWTTNQNWPGMRGGYLIRVNAALGLVWDRQYGTARDDDYFWGVDEVPAGFIGGGDLVAAGGSNSAPAIGYDIFVVRVDGNTSNVAVFPQNESWTDLGVPVGTGNDEEAHAVIVLRNGPNAGDIVVAGHSNGAPGPSFNDEVFVVEFGPDPCNQIANVYFGDNGGLRDRAYDLVEDENPPLPGGSNVVVTGFTNVPGGFGLDDVFLQRITTGPGMALLGPAGVYGGDLNDQGWSVGNATRNIPISAESPGYIVNGFTQSPGLIGPADPQQLYLIKTDVMLNSLCNFVLIPFQGARAVNSTACGTALGPNIGLEAPAIVDSLGWVWDNRLCYTPSARRNDGGNDGAAGVDAAITFGEGPAYPNPLRAGDVLNLRFDLATSANGHITVSDMTGRELYRTDVALGGGANVVPVGTTGWASGVYLVRITVGGVTAHRSVVLQ